jgi:single-stranded-DNA-specific exonuclease
VATKLSQKFNKPAFVGSENAEGIIVGSSRLPPQHPACLVTALQSAAGLLQRFGGHSPAAGFEVAVGQVAGLVEQLALHFSQALQPGSTARPVVCDGDVNIAELQRSWMDWYDLLGPMGVGFAVPIFLFSVQVNGIKELKGGHLKLQLRATDKPQGSNDIEALLFSPSAQQKEHLGASVQNYDVKLLGEVQWNYFAGQKKIQILVKDVVL